MLLEDQASVQLSLIPTILGNRGTAYFEIASIAVLVYDYFLTFRLEVGLVWNTPWNVGKILFFLTRYTVFIDASLLGYFHLAGGGVDSITTCRVIYQVSGWAIFVGTGIAESVLIFRTWAIWGQSRRVAIGLTTLLLGLGIPSIYLTHIGISSVKFIESPIPLTQRCFISEIKDVSMLSNYLVIPAVETVVFVLTLIKGMQHYRLAQSSLVTTLYKDGILYYAYLFAVSMANVVVYAFHGETHGASLILLQRVFHSIFTARILLDLRLAAVQGRQELIMVSTPIFTTVAFASLSSPVVSENDTLSPKTRYGTHELV